MNSNQKKLKVLRKQLSSHWANMGRDNIDEWVKLHADLQSHIDDQPSGKSIHHPLLVAFPFHDHWFSIREYNLRYEIKKLQKEEAVRTKDIREYIFLHERPYRVHALLDAYLHWWNPEEPDWWKTVANVWIDSENIFQKISYWKSILTEQFSCPHLMMDEKDKKIFNELPAWINIYRGGYDDKGFSWTLDKEKAEWFSNRFKFLHPEMKVFEKRISKLDALAYLRGRDEAEIIYIPEE